MFWFICLALVQADGDVEVKDNLQNKGNPASFPLHFMTVLRHNIWLLLAALTVLLVVALLFALLRRKTEDTVEKAATEQTGLVLKGRTKRQPRVKWYGVLAEDQRPENKGSDLSCKMSPCELSL
jgi:hypothetical protein